MSLPHLALCMLFETTAITHGSHHSACPKDACSHMHTRQQSLRISIIKSPTLWLKKTNQARKKKSDESYTPVAPLMTLDCRAWIKTLGCMLWTVYIPALRLQKDLTPKWGDDVQNKALAEVALGWSWCPTLTQPADQCVLHWDEAQSELTECPWPRMLSSVHSPHTHP